MKTTISILAMLAACAVGFGQTQVQPGKVLPNLKLGKAIKLFNEKDMTGWTYCLTDPNVKMEDVWHVDTREKSIVCKGTPNGYIRTTTDYTNFILKLEWRWPDPKNAVNSGVLLRMVGPDKVWPKSIEAQLMTGTAGDFFLIDGEKLVTPPDHPNKLNGIYQQRVKTAEKPMGEWNDYEIIVNGGEIILKINGELVNHGLEAEEVAGKICLQSEGGEIHFRNIRLYPIMRPAPPAGK